MAFSANGALQDHTYRLRLAGELDIGTLPDAETAAATAFEEVWERLVVDLNILRGDMAIVGPRPERTNFVRSFEEHVYRYGDRHRVKSGLTGWAQVQGLRGQTSLDDRVEWDNYYIENWSLWLDLKIILMTVPALLGRHDVE